MAKTGLLDVTANNTFQVWLDRTNELVDLLGTDVITASVSGDNTGQLGNPKAANLFGTFSANTLIANTRLRADTIDTISGSTSITLEAPTTVNTTQRVALETFSSSANPVVRINNNTISWDVGFSSDSQTFIVNDGSGSDRLQLSTAGDLTITGTFTAAGGISGSNITGDITGNVTGDLTGNVTGDLTGNVTGDLTGNADTASTLASPRLIALSGDVNGSASFDGSSDITISATVSDDSHNHTISNIDGLQAQLDSKVTGVIAGTGLTGGGTSGNVTINGVTQVQNYWTTGSRTVESLVSPAKIKAAIEALAPNFNYDSGYVSSWTLPYSVAHGLGSSIQRFEVVCKCRVATGGFDVGDLFSLPQLMDGDGARRRLIYANSTNVIVNNTPAGATPSGSLFSPSDANFDIRVLAWSD